MYITCKVKLVVVESGYLHVVLELTSIYSYPCMSGRREGEVGQIIDIYGQMNSIYLCCRWLVVWNIHLQHSPLSQTLKIVHDIEADKLLSVRVAMLYLFKAVEPGGMLLGGQYLTKFWSLTESRPYTCTPPQDMWHRNQGGSVGWLMLHLPLYIIWLVQ